MSFFKSRVEAQVFKNILQIVLNPPFVVFYRQSSGFFYGENKMKNELIIPVKTMSSLEIAKLTGKQHKDVLETIRKTLEEAEISTADFSAVYKASNGKNEPCFNLPRRECDLVISGYSVKYRLAIIDRWQELENKPLTIVDYARALVESHDRIQLLEKEQELTNTAITELRDDVRWIEDRLEKEIENKKLYGWRK